MSDDQTNDMPIEELQTKATANLRAAGGRPDALADAILSYLREGYGMGLGPDELVDYFCVSTPNIVEAAGYMDVAGDDVVALFDQLHDRFRLTGG